ncbi:SH3 domain-containing protein [Streptomyces sp. VRA16 Mangrove soil]|uniref:SH3 domain-containing protein n=1 Tax=Streptomyces sp. VRA16 Mangrove soil TaxID=2817434 RepID=UPI001A9CC18B|nr:SH3 domain-containing protein [Streptomyces sp. VRA16 Mangrove soil]MBO1333581.1 SH3 domain-containing protein [Streptomyces sp. VRA16 Mangrove soil]
MRRTPVALATTALLTGGVLAVTAAAPASADSGGGDPIWGTVVSSAALNVRSGPSTSSSVVYRLAPGSQDRIECATNGTSVNGNSTWYWFIGARGWASASYVSISANVPSCDTPCPPDQHQGGGGGPSSFWFRSDYRVEFGYVG